MKLAVVAALLASASAFAPVSQKTSSTALKAFENELGAQPPVSKQARCDESRFFSYFE
jgi:Chlorophyll A-B binding protein